MNTREEMLARMRRSQPAPVALPELPGFANGDSSAAADYDSFAAALERMGGKLAPAPAGGDADAAVRALFPEAKVICSATHEVRGTRPLDPAQPPATLDDVDVGVVRAVFGVAETGSVLLTETELQVEALGFLAQHLVVLLDPARIVATLHDAYRHPAFTQARYAILMTGPSATADIEGVLIHGAQGIRSLTLLPHAG
ncbi:MAG: LUD domain-containing protein [Rubrivivax sp.]|nr:LUD domain-containing protein [Rubrivivax sp.]